MRANFTVGIVVFLLAGSLAAAPVLPYQKAVEEARRSGRDVMVLCIGGGWMKDAEAYRDLFGKVAARASDADTIWALFDTQTFDISPKNRKKILPLPLLGYPAWIYTDARQRPLWHRECLDLKEIARLPSLAQELSGRRKRRDAGLKRASSLRGIERARAIGSSLDESLNAVIEHFTIREVRAYLGRYRGLVEQIQEADPEDQSGYAFKLTFYYLDILTRVIFSNAERRNFSKNDLYLDRKLALPVLTTYQRQQLLVFKYVSDRMAGRMKEALVHLDEAIALSPDSPFSGDCRRMKAYHSEPLTLSSLRWGPRENRAEWTLVSAPVSAALEGAGTYCLVFKNENRGRFRFRNPLLQIGDRVLARAVGQGHRYQFTLGKVPAGEVKLLFEMKGSRRLKGGGTIVIRKKK